MPPIKPSILLFSLWLGSQHALIAAELTAEEKQQIQLSSSDWEPQNCIRQDCPSAFIEAVHLQRKQQWKKAAARYQLALQKEEQFESYYNQGLCFEKLKQYSKAEKSLLNAIKFSKLSKEANKHLSNVYLQLGQEDKAEAFASRVMDL